MIRAADYDCILLDMKMPGSNGNEVFEQAIEHTPRLAGRIIFMTGDTANPQTDSFLSSIGNLVIRKPFTLHDVRECVSGVSNVD